MVPVRGRFIFRGCMALRTDAGARHLQCGAVQIVVVAVGYTFCEHLALLERSVVVGLLVVAHLAIGMEAQAVEQAQAVGIRERSFWRPFLRELAASSERPQAWTSLRNARIWALRTEASTCR